MTIEIRHDDDGVLDELIVRDPTLVHMERMDTARWWMRIDRADGDSVVLWFRTQRNFPVPLVELDPPA